MVGWITQEIIPQLQVVLMNAPGRDREIVKAVIADLKMFMKGKLDRSFFLSSDCTHVGSL